MKNEFCGVGTALITPFFDDGSIDYKTLEKLVCWQIESGVDFLVPCGTTGETVNFSDSEYEKVIQTVVKSANRKAKILVGSGSNSTQKTIHYSQIAAKSGADAILVVTPYYNKPTQNGLIAHFETVATNVDLPIILYNVPGRTGVNLQPSTTLQLSQNPKIIGVKEASGNLSQIMEIVSQKPKDFVLLSGDDSLTLAITACGGNGVISVASNVFPKEFAKLVHFAIDGKIPEAQELQYRFLKLMDLLFIESNPIPAKTCLVLMDKISENFRLPLVKMSDSNKILLSNELINLNLI
ncbi:MAG: 4-hydroxy-tetrahydrodipicolinate synthase [Calditrichaeota bacterium]|nr:MAG: 4-hydroxy-tetrahydrodipicolinate synthase [Calditrichota bacterium]